MPLLKIDSVELSYDGRKILQDVFLQCQSGEVLGILGRNGSGKSSLLKVIFGSVNAEHKYMSVDDVYIDKGYTHHHIAYLPQHNYLPVHVPVFQLAELIINKEDWGEFSSFPVYQLNHKKRIKEVSGGEQRQLEILMVLYSAAPFILLDEPFTHISPIQAEALKELIKKRSAVKGIIVTDHQYYNVLDVAHRIILMNNGRTQPLNNQEDLVTYGYLSGL
ncbi:ATP-binding cassette domain-containing protein [Mucilaginibacter sp.]